MERSPSILKVFFKRCHEEYFLDGDFSKYPCVNKNENCEINFEEPIRCKFCRYMKCLRLGMDPNRILEGEAKKKFCKLKYKNSMPDLVSSMTAVDLNSTKE